MRNGKTKKINQNKRNKTMIFGELVMIFTLVNQNTNDLFVLCHIRYRIKERTIHRILQVRKRAKSVTFAADRKRID